MFSFTPHRTTDHAHAHSSQRATMLRICALPLYIGLTPFVSIHVRSFQSWFNSGDRPVYLPPFDFSCRPAATIGHRRPTATHATHGCGVFFIVLRPSPFPFTRFSFKGKDGGGGGGRGGRCAPTVGNTLSNTRARARHTHDTKVKAPRCPRPMCTDHLSNCR